MTTKNKKRIMLTFKVETIDKLNQIVSYTKIHAPKLYNKSKVIENIIEAIYISNPEVQNDSRRS